MVFQRTVIDVAENNDGEKMKMSLMWMKAMMKGKILRM